MMKIQVEPITNLFSTFVREDSVGRHGLFQSDRLVPSPFRCRVYELQVNRLFLLGLLPAGPIGVL